MLVLVDVKSDAITELFNCCLNVRGRLLSISFQEICVRFGVFEAMTGEGGARGREGAREWLARGQLGKSEWPASRGTWLPVRLSEPIGAGAALDPLGNLCFGSSHELAKSSRV